jgi:hypothetical protein
VLVSRPLNGIGSGKLPRPLILNLASIALCFTRVVVAKEWIEDPSGRRETLFRSGSLIWLRLRLVKSVNHLNFAGALSRGVFRGHYPIPLGQKALPGIRCHRWQVRPGEGPVVRVRKGKQSAHYK